MCSCDPTIPCHGRLLTDKPLFIILRLKIFGGSEIKTTINTEKIPIKLWLDDIEEGALKQARNIANHPFAYRHIAIMPDAHQGYGMPIGGVMATVDVIVPNAVGVDIGCGMIAARTTSMADALDEHLLKSIMGDIRQRIPVGFNRHRSPQKWSGFDKAPSIPVVQKEIKNARLQIGTMGGSNHFIEIQKDTNDRVWVMVHSGSRNFGLQIARHYNQLAVKLNERSSSPIPKSWELAYLPLDHTGGRQYLKAMTFAVAFALANRRLMLQRIGEILFDTAGIEMETQVNIAHNYAVAEKHFGKEVMVHRKGATRARKGELGIIPGSQGTASYIVRGLGNPDSFHSCSHGAGRKMGRKEARRKLNLEVEKQRLTDLGVIHSIRSKKHLDEAASAYKDISIVMENQTDLVEIVEELMPLAVIKA
jgi:tRNA-splicing ligase RtcB